MSSKKPKDTTKYKTVAIAVGAAARILVREGFTQDQAAELMRCAWVVVQHKSNTRRSKC